MNLTEAPSPLETAIRHVTNQTAPKYRQWGVTPDDIHSELWLYCLSNKQVETWLLAGEEFRAHRALFAAAKAYSEQEKAHKVGYNPDDVAWYSPGKLAELLPVALAEFDGIVGQREEHEGGGKPNGREGGNLLAMIVDVRRAVNVVGSPYVDEHGEYADDYLEKLSDFLGGEFPNAPGYRRAHRQSMSNAAAQSLTSRVEQGGVA